MELHADVPFIGIIELERNPNSQLIDNVAPSRNVIDFADHHVTGIPTVSGDIATGCSCLEVGRHRGDTFKKLGADRP